MSLRSPNIGSDAALYLPPRFLYFLGAGRREPTRLPCLSNRLRISARRLAFRSFPCGLRMAVLLQLRDAHKSYGHQVLLDGAEVTLTDAHKVGFIGRNGAGKSTLCKVLLGEEELDQGEVICHPQLAAGILAAARSVSARRDRARVSDARQRRSPTGSAARWPAVSS